MNQAHSVLGLWKPLLRPCFLHLVSSSSRLPLNHFAPSLSPTVRGSSRLWAGGLLGDGRSVAGSCPVRHVKRAVHTDLSRPCYTTAWWRITCGCTVDSQRHRRTVQVLEESLKTQELFCWHVSHGSSSLHCVTISAACVKIQQCGCISTVLALEKSLSCPQLVI